MNPLMPKVELMGEMLPNMEFLLVVDPKNIFFGMLRFHVRFSTHGHHALTFNADQTVINLSVFNQR